MSIPQNPFWVPQGTRGLKRPSSVAAVLGGAEWIKLTSDPRLRRKQQRLPGGLPGT